MKNNMPQIKTIIKYRQKRKGTLSHKLINYDTQKIEDDIIILVKNEKKISYKGEKNKKNKSKIE